MLEFKKAIKEVEKLESMVNVILNDENNSGYRVEISFANGQLYDENKHDYDTDIYVISNYSNFNDKNKIAKIKFNSRHEQEVKLPCTIIGDPLKNKGKIKNIEFDKKKVLEELKNNQKYITNSKLGIIEVPNKEGYISVKHLYSPNIKVYFDNQ